MVFRLSLLIVIQLQRKRIVRDTVPEKVKARSSLRSEVGAHSSHNWEYIGRQPDYIEKKNKMEYCYSKVYLYTVTNQTVYLQTQMPKMF